MKMTSLFWISVITTAFVACANKNSATSKKATKVQGKTSSADLLAAKKAAELSRQQAQNKNGASTLPADAVGKSSYVGKNLTLIIPHDNNFGYVHIEGDEAEKLYKVMEIKSTTGNANDNWNAAEIKNGINVSCFKQSAKESPTVLEYSCNLYLNYKTGEITSNVSEIEKGTPELTLEENFKGPHLSLVTLDQEHPDTIKIDGKDAEALFAQMNVEEVKSSGTEKNGKNISCVQVVDGEKKSAACTIKFNQVSGRVEVL